MLPFDRGTGATTTGASIGKPSAMPTTGANTGTTALPLSEPTRVSHTDTNEEELANQQKRGKVEKGFKEGDR